MMKKTSNKLVFLFVFLSLLSACKVTKLVPEDQFLYTGHKLNIHFETVPKNTIESTSVFENQLGPATNRRFLGIRARLHFYNFGRRNKETKGFRKFVHKTLGEAPVLYNDIYPKQIESNLKTEAIKQGYFNSNVTFSLTTKRKKAFVTYDLYLKKPYFIKNVVVKENGSEFSDSLQKYDFSTLIGEPFNYNLLTKTLDNIEQYAKNNGFYFFNKKYLKFQLDTTNVPSQELELKLVILPKAPLNALKSFNINSISIYSNHKTDTVEQLISQDGIDYYQTNSKYKPKLFFRHIYLKKDKLYSEQKLNNSLNHFREIGTFSYVDAKFELKDSIDPKLDVTYNLTSGLPKEFQSKLTFSSKSNGFIGPLWENSIINKNFLKQGEKLILTLDLGIEKQLFQDYAIKYILTTGIGLELRFPRILLPFKVSSKQDRSLPNTSFYLQYYFYHYEPYYNSLSFGPRIMYSWTNKQNVLFEFSVFEINYRHNFGNYSHIDTSNAYVSRALEDRLILGSNYFFTFQSKNKRFKKSYTYWRTGFDLSGNFAQVLYPTDKQTIKNKKIAGVPFAQFIKYESELKYKRILTKRSEAVSRLITNIGIPYGNSDILPYFKEYSIGGPYSLRGFLPRRIGPGVFTHSNTETDFVLHSAEIWLEANFEYRKKLFNYFEIGLFAEAGNIWNLKPNPYKPGGAFGKDFYRQLACDAGLGLRLNLDYLVVRLDIGAPLRNPNGWIYNEYDLEKPMNGFFKKLIWNLAIGYPF